MQELSNNNDRIFNQGGGENLAIRTNTFAIPVLTNTVGIIDWTIEKIKQIDVRTRMNSNLMINSNRSNIIKFVCEQEQKPSSEFNKSYLNATMQIMMKFQH